MSFGFGFALPAYPLRGGTGNNPFNQLGPTLDLSFTGVVTDLTDPNGYTLNTNFIIPQYQIAAQYVVWETGVGLVDKTFSQIITFSRTSIGTYFDSAGVLQTATSGTPRFDYDPVTLAPRGFLIEEARTNLMLYSEQFDNAWWTKSAATVTANATTSPDGTVDAEKLIATAVSANHYILSGNATISAGATVTASVFVKAAEYNTIRVAAYNTAITSGFRVDANLSTVTGTTGTLGTGSTIGSSVTNVGGGWYRITVTGVVDAGSTAIQMWVQLLDAGVTPFLGNGTSGIFIFGAQLEAGAFPTSYIPTTTGTVPRNADQALVNTVSPWFNATAGTLYAEVQHYFPSASVQQWQAQLASGSGDYIGIYKESSPAYITTRMRSGGSDQAFAYTTGVISANTTYKTAIAYAVNDVASCSSGGQVFVDTPPAALPLSVTALGLGQPTYTTSVMLNGWLRRIVYYPRRLTNDELRTLTLPTGATITTQDYSLDTNFVGNTVAIGS